jgi:potassium-transporting ATPase KdpC subunit
MIRIQELTTAIRSILLLWLLTAIIYPLIILSIGQIAFSSPANGSLITKDNKTIGSTLIGQPFTTDRYFWSRPSTINYSTDKTAAPTGVSGASNLAPSNSDLTKRITSEIDRLKKAPIQPTNDLVYTSGSGLDPHISIEAARNQIPRITTARKLDKNRVEFLITDAIDDRFLGIFGEPGVNVLKLNLALDRLAQQ